MGKDIDLSRVEKEEIYAKFVPLKCIAQKT